MMTLLKLKLKPMLMLMAMAMAMAMLFSSPIVTVVWPLIGCSCS